MDLWYCLKCCVLAEKPVIWTYGTRAMSSGIMERLLTFISKSSFMPCFFSLKATESAHRDISKTITDPNLDKISSRISANFDIVYWSVAVVERNTQLGSRLTLTLTKDASIS